MFPGNIAPRDGMRPSLFVNIWNLCRDVNCGEPESSIQRTEPAYRIPRRGQGTPLYAMAFAREPAGRISERSLPKCLPASVQHAHSFKYSSNFHIRSVSCPSDYVHSKSSLPPTRRRQIRKVGDHACASRSSHMFRERGIYFRACLRLCDHIYRPFA